MEIIVNTTIQELPEKLRSLNISPETHIRVIIEEIKEKDAPKVLSKKKHPKFQFINEDIWDKKNTPTDLSENHDKYLYGEE